MGKGALDPDEISSPNCLSTDSVGLSFALSLSLCRFRSVALSLCRSVALSLCVDGRCRRNQSFSIDQLDCPARGCEMICGSCKLWVR